MPVRFAVRQLGRGLDAAGIAPTIARDGAWKATVAGLAAYFAWQVLVAAAAAASYWERATDGPCVVGPACVITDGWGDGRTALVSLLVLTASLPVLLVVARVGLGVWRRRFWAAWAARLVGWSTAIGGLVLVLVGGLPWIVLGAWTAWWARRLRFEPPAWAATQPPAAPPGPQDVIEGERA